MRPSEMLSDRDFGQVAETMADPVLDACRADALLFSFETADPGRRCELSYARDTEDTPRDLVTALGDFCREKQEIRLAFEPGGIKPHETEGGAEYVLVLVPIATEHRRYGALALAIHRANWLEHRTFAACGQVAQLASMTLDASLTRLKLERDLTELNRRTLLLQRQSEIDPLTGVENKASFEARAKDRLSDPARRAALILIDLDYFKDVNDVYGHQFGDIYLQTIGGAMRSSLPPAAVIGRVGGDEFAALVDVPDPAGTYLNDIIDRLRGSVARKVALLGKSDLGDLSVGVSMSSAGGTGYAELFRSADAALYSSKDEGRNRTRFHVSAETSCPGTAPGMWGEAEMFATVTPAFQPIVDLHSGVCTGLEVLARREGIPAADGSRGLEWMFRDHAFAPRLTRHVLGCALAMAARLPQAGRPSLWINMTKFDLLDAEFVFDVQDLLEKHGFGWADLVAEVHEGVILSDRSGRIYHTLRDMRRLGARIALDDFGVGYAGLTHLRDWPVDIIKIDRDFVRDIHHDSFSHVVVGALVSITACRGIEIVAEGIETAAQAEAVRSLGCRFGQGFHFDPALPPDDLGPRLATYPAKHAATRAALGKRPLCVDV